MAIDPVTMRRRKDVYRIHLYVGNASVLSEAMAGFYLDRGSDMNPVLPVNSGDLRSCDVAIETLSIGCGFGCRFKRCSWERRRRTGSDATEDRWRQP